MTIEETNVDEDDKRWFKWRRLKKKITQDIHIKSSVFIKGDYEGINPTYDMMKLLFIKVDLF
jgi:hypothetical protein